MMNIMMYVMVVFFYRVPAGLCLYFIMSSVWGTTERLIMKRLNARKKKALADSAGADVIVPAAPPARTAKADEPAAKSDKPSVFGEIRRQFRELQEKADKEASIRKQGLPGSSANGDRKGKKHRGRG